MQVPRLPDQLEEPMLFLSVRQSPVVASKFPSLQRYDLPAWVPQRLVARDLGLSQQGMKLATQHTAGKPYCWATELENVHSLWRYDEPRIQVDGQVHACSEDYYHSQKPRPFDDELWTKQKDDVMLKALRAKLGADPTLESLLRATGNHTLLAIKADTYWGFDPRRGGRNRLAELWMKLRSELVELKEATTFEGAKAAL